MSDIQNTTNNINTQEAAATVAGKANPLTLMRRMYQDKGRVLVMSGDDMTTFADFIGDFDETNPATDWSKGAPWANPSVAMVEVEESGANRLIAIAPIADALADPAVRDWAYKQYLRHVLKVAASNDASAEKFLTAAGAFRPKFDIEAFKTEARILVPYLRSKGLKGISAPLLREAFRNSAFAVTQFSRVPAETWEKLLDTCIDRAAQRGEDVSLFNHWKATRNVLKDSGEEITLDFEELGKELDEALADEEPAAAAA